MLGEIELLVNQHDARGFRIARAVKALRVAVDQHRALRGRLVAREDFHQRRLARAVFAEQTVDAPRREIEAHAVQHAHGAEVFADIVESDGEAHRGFPLKRSF